MYARASPVAFSLSLLPSISHYLVSKILSFFFISQATHFAVMQWVSEWMSEPEREREHGKHYYSWRHRRLPNEQFVRERGNEQKYWNETKRERKRKGERDRGFELEKCVCEWERERERERDRPNESRKVKGCLYDSLSLSLSQILHSNRASHCHTLSLSISFFMKKKERKKKAYGTTSLSHLRRRFLTRRKDEFMHVFISVFISAPSSAASCMVIFS